MGFNGFNVLLNIYGYIQFAQAILAQHTCSIRNDAYLFFDMYVLFRKIAGADIVII